MYCEERLQTVVGIPTMNNEETIELTLRQLESQTLQPDSVIIVDASNDSTPEIIRSVNATSDLNIEYHRQSDRGRGVGAARKDIYEHFEGDLLLCMDTDHSVPEDWVEIHTRFHKNHPEYDVLSNSGRTTFDGPVDDPKQSEFFGQSNCSIKREALDAVKGWDPWFHRGEDWDMRIRLYTAGIDSYAKSEVRSWRFERNIVSDAVSWFRTKITQSPSSVTFLRKYGTWYVRFHPLHVLGDTLSLVSLFCLVLTPLAAFVEPLLGGALLAVPISGSLGYLYYKRFRKRDRFTVLWRDLNSLLVFFALGLSMLYNLRRLGEDAEWNYAGFQDDHEPDSRIR